MKIRNLIKATFFVSALINLSPSGNAIELFSNDLKNFSQSKNINWVNKVYPKNIHPSGNISFQKYKIKYKINFKDQILHNYIDETPLLLASSLEIKNEL